MEPPIKWPRTSFNHKSNPKDFIRLFVLVRTDIPYEHQAVQAGHAALKYVMENTLTIQFNRDVHNRDEYNSHIASILYDSLYYDDQFIGQNFTWDNGTLIYLGVDNEFELSKWQKKLNDWGIQNSMFEEPDWVRRNVDTALACMGFRGDFSELPLLKMPKGFFASRCKSEPLNIT